MHAPNAWVGLSKYDTNKCCSIYIFARFYTMSEMDLSSIILASIGKNLFLSNTLFIKTWSYLSSIGYYRAIKSDQFTHPSTEEFHVRRRRRKKIILHTFVFLVSNPEIILILICQKLLSMNIIHLRSVVRRKKCLI